METKPLRADAERNRQRLLDAAADLFVERGFDVSLVEIAERAGVGVATAYRRFPEKEQLVDELFDRQLGVVVSSAEEGLEADDPWEGFAGTLERILTHLAENRALKQIISGELRT
ncbi:MAG: helix-turn-helix transcriptional regulator, partial [Solirubrobacteraceae bacterium]|nr:helix-turn-helix transcriptional regulator [Solirubrobacteraceae bacterium]